MPKTIMVTTTIILTLLEIITINFNLPPADLLIAMLDKSNLVHHARTVKLTLELKPTTPGVLVIFAHLIRLLDSMELAPILFVLQAFKQLDQ